MYVYTTNSFAKNQFCLHDLDSPVDWIRAITRDQPIPSYFLYSTEFFCVLFFFHLCIRIISSPMFVVFLFIYFFFFFIFDSFFWIRFNMYWFNFRGIHEYHRQIHKKKREKSDLCNANIDIFLIIFFAAYCTWKRKIWDSKVGNLEKRKRNIIVN